MRILFQSSRARCRRTQLILVEYNEHPVGAETRHRDNRRTLMRAKDTLKSNLEDARYTLLSGDRGRVVIVEGQHGVGKTRMAAQVFLHPSTISAVLTGVGFILL